MAKVEFESPLPHKHKHLKPVPVAGFIFSSKNSDNTVPNLYHYRTPKLKKAKNIWYIEYYYRVPLNVRDLYNGKEWLRFRIKKDINRRTGSERQEYADWLLQEITSSLKGGYNPFNPASEYAAEEIEEKQVLNITDALNLFLEKWKTRGLDPLSYMKYERYVKRLIDWLTLKKIPYRDVTEITQNHIENFLTDMKQTHQFSNREYNNHFDFIRTAFNFLLKKKYITESPCAGIEKQKVKVTKHRFYDAKALDEITRALKVQDPFTWLVFQAVYYLCVRSDKELSNLKVGNIQWEQSVILAEVSKTDQRYIPMDDNIKFLLKEHIKDAPGEYYIFGAYGNPAAIPFSHGLYAKKFRKVRDLIGMSDKYTLYGAKHTRVIDLKQSGATDADVMSLTGHKDFVSYAKYLRDIGLAADMEKLNKLSRKI